MVTEQAMAREQAWEENFAFLEYLWDEEDAFWAAAGWNVNHDDGEQLLLMEHVGRQLVCVVKQLMPEAIFSPTGKHAPISEARLTSRLEDEARRFVASKRRGSQEWSS